MKKTVPRLAAIAGTLAALALIGSALGCSERAERVPAQAQSALERGKYLADGVAGCYDCHTPRLPTGEPDRTRWLQGAPLFFAPVQPIPGWVATAPAIAGGPAGWSEEQLVSFLESGLKPGGVQPAPPMPAFRLSHDDAVAVAAYLRSLAAVPAK